MRAGGGDVPGTSSGASAREIDKAALTDRVSRLIRFLRDLSQSQAAPVYDVDEYPLAVWLADLPDQVQVDAAATPAATVLTVTPVPAEPPPGLPGELVGWVSLDDRDNSALPQPALRDSG